MSDYYYMELDRKKRNTAGFKAPADISSICAKRGYTCIKSSKWPHGGKVSYRINYVIWGFWQWVKLFFHVKSRCSMVYQHPSLGNRVSLIMARCLKKIRKVKFIGIVHDLESIRGGINGVVGFSKKNAEMGDMFLLKEFDAVICHNSSMIEYMVSKGFDRNKLIDLGIFDYLSSCDRVQPKKSDSPTIAVAANLAFGKCGYIYRMFENEENEANSNLIVNLYGANYDREKSLPNHNYLGQFAPEELPKYLEGDFGLVWDGPSANTCEGNTGYYLRYNNPHKTSFYLSANMPVIVWSEAAVAKFVKENGVGICIDSLYDLETTIASISGDDYEIMCENVRRISGRIRTGYYTNLALDKAEAILEG